MQVLDKAPSPPKLWFYYIFGGDRNQSIEEVKFELEVEQLRVDAAKLLQPEPKKPQQEVRKAIADSAFTCQNMVGRALASNPPNLDAVRKLTVVADKLLSSPLLRPPPDDRSDEAMTPEERAARDKAWEECSADRASLLSTQKTQLDTAVGLESQSSNANSPINGLLEKTKGDRLMAGVKSSDPFRAALAETAVRSAMVAMEAKVRNVVADEYQEAVLAKLGTKLTAVIDEMVREAVLKYMVDTKVAATNTSPGGSYSIAMADLLGESSADNPVGAALFQEYSGLQERINLEATQFATNLNELCDRVANDKADLEDKMFGHQPMKGLKDITVADSDPHNGGRRVTILTFEGNDGGDHKVVNKPRDVRVDAKFVGKTGKTGMAASLSERATELMRSRTPDIKDLPTYTFLDKNDGHRYGWVEFIEHGRKEDCVLDKKQAEGFYQQTGQLAALAFMCGIEDIHHGNIMIHNGQPVLTDLEIAFSSKAFEKLDMNSKPDDVKDYINTKLINTMIAQGLGSGTQVTHEGNVMVSGDQIRRRAKETGLEATENTVFYKESDTVLKSQTEGMPQQFKANFALGFSQVCDAFGDPSLKDQNDLFMETFKNMQVRYHALATAEQLRMRREEMHDGYHQSIDESVESMKVKAKKAMAGRIERRPKMAAIIDSMGEDLAKRDVAYYTQTLGSKEVLHNGTTRIASEKNEDLLETDGIDVAKQNMMLMREFPKLVKQLGAEVMNRLNIEGEYKAIAAIKQKMQPELQS